MFFLILPAYLCVFTRAFLNVCDRQIFKNENMDFYKNVVLNALLPFFIALGVAYFFNNGEEDYWEYLFYPGVILSALGAQLTACIGHVHLFGQFS